MGQYFSMRDFPAELVQYIGVLLPPRRLLCLALVCRWFATCLLGSPTFVALYQHRWFSVPNLVRAELTDALRVEVRRNGTRFAWLNLAFTEGHHAAMAVLAPGMPRPMPRLGDASNAWVHVVRTYRGTDWTWAHRLLQLGEYNPQVDWSLLKLASSEKVPPAGLDCLLKCSTVRRSIASLGDERKRLCKYAIYFWPPHMAADLFSLIRWDGPMWSWLLRQRHVQPVHILAAARHSQLTTDEMHCIVDALAARFWPAHTWALMQGLDERPDLPRMPDRGRTMCWSLLMNGRTDDEIQFWLDEYNRAYPEERVSERDLAQSDFWPLVQDSALPPGKIDADMLAHDGGTLIRRLLHEGRWDVLRRASHAPLLRARIDDIAHELGVPDWDQ